MNKEIEAIYERGMIRPLQPVELPKRARLDLIVYYSRTAENEWQHGRILAEIAALPLEGSSDPFASREHDSIL